MEICGYTLTEKDWEWLKKLDPKYDDMVVHGEREAQILSFCKNDFNVAYLQYFDDNSFGSTHVDNLCVIPHSSKWNGKTHGQG